MRFILLIGVFVCVRATAQQWAVSPANGTTTESHFRWPNARCKQDADEGIETTPQSPPLDVDDPDTPGCNTWEINVLATSETTPHDTDRDLPLFDINYGVGNNIELTYMLPMANHQSDESSATGYGNSNVGVKYLFYQSDEQDVELALYPQVQMSPNAQAVDQEIAEAGTIVGLPILFSKKLKDMDLGDVMLSVNLGYNLVSGSPRSDFISAAAGVGAPIFARTSLMGEISTEQGVHIVDGTREQLVKANLGAVGTINRWFELYGSFGQSLKASDNLNHLYASAGVRLLTDGSF